MPEQLLLLLVGSLGAVATTSVGGLVYILRRNGHTNGNASICVSLGRIEGTLTMQTGLLQELVTAEAVQVEAAQGRHVAVIEALRRQERPG